MSSVDEFLDELKDEYGSTFGELGPTYESLANDLFDSFLLIFSVRDEDLGEIRDLPAGSPSPSEIKAKAQAPYKAMAYLLAAAIRGTTSDD
jgi:hypothetical protein